MDYVQEPQKAVPVVRDADVAVAGAGVAGVFAAIAAARHGARTVLIDRFGSVGGNIGPGMINNGHMISGSAHPTLSHECTVAPGLYGIGREFVDRTIALGGGAIPPDRPANYPGDASIASYVAQQMLDESGVDVLLSTWVADPMMDGVTVRGVFVENKSGRGAVRAAVTVDATGEADVARRAGAPILLPADEYTALDGHAPTGIGLYYLAGGIDWAAHRAAMAAGQPAEEDIHWGRDALGEAAAGRMGALLPCLRAAAERGGFVPRAFVTIDGQPIPIEASGPGECAGGLGHGRAQPALTQALDAGSGDHIAALEAALRTRIFEVFRAWRDHVPGFERAFLIVISPFLGARGGPCIEGEVVLTMQDCREGRMFGDVMYRYGEFRALRWTAEQGAALWVDVPYRVMLPRGIDGLLAAGRSASGQPDTLLRNRMAAKVMGQACGSAAALCARAGVQPRDLDIGVLQRDLLRQGFHLGDAARLAELGLA